ncbi:MAG: lipoyl(octanoyl) transferase LipB [Acidobacteriota bacterium]
MAVLGTAMADCAMSQVTLRIDLGRRAYSEVWELQRRLVRWRQAHKVPDVLLFVEHPPTYTLGRSGRLEHLVIDEQALDQTGAVFVRSDRGGGITFHGPGQVVGYPIVGLQGPDRDVHLYLRRLEEVLIRTLVRFGIEAGRQEGLTGVWHRDGKVAAIGVRVARWVTSHGFALNVSTDLRYFNRIVPCGIVGKGVVSMESILGAPVSMRAVTEALAWEFGGVFNRQLLAVSEMTLNQEENGEVGKAPAS